MKRTEFEALLTRSLHNAPNMENSLGNTVLLAKRQVSRNRKSGRIPFRRFLLKQVRYIGWRLWAAQALMLLIFDRMVIRRCREHFWDSPISAARLLLCISTLAAMMALPTLYRSRKHRMQELESACRFSSADLLMAKLAVIGIGTVIFLTGMLLMTTAITSMGAGSLAFCLFSPFLAASAAYLYMMGHCSADRFFVGSVTLGIAMLLIAAVIPAQWLSLFQQSMLHGRILLCAGLLIFSAEQLRYLLYRSPYARLQVS